MEKSPLLLTNLYPGMEVKSYRELCQLLQQPVLSGASKRAQLKIFKQYMDFTKVPHSNKYQINSIYSEPLVEVPKIPRTTALQCYSLMYDLCQEIPYYEPGEVITTHRTQKQLHLLLGICNPDYYKHRVFLKHSSPCEREQYKRSIFGEFPVEHVKEFYQEVDTRGKGYVGRLTNNFIDGCVSDLVVTRKTFNIEINGKFRVCTADEYTHIFEAMRNVRLSDTYIITDDNGQRTIATDRQLYCSGQIPAFYKEVLQTDWVVSQGISKIYYIWEFSFTDCLIHTLDRYAELNKIVQTSVLNELNEKSVKYHDMRTLKKETKILTDGKDCFLPEEVLEEWLDTHYRPSRELLRTLIQLQPTKP